MGNGMKSGSGGDPFADVDEDDDSEQVETDQATGTAESATEAGSSNSGSETTGEIGGSGLPWKYARSNAKDGREMVQFFLQQETQALESEKQAELESMLDENVLALDLREAAYRIALEQHLDDVADFLRDWGYDPD